MRRRLLPMPIIAAVAIVATVISIGVGYLIIQTRPTPGPRAPSPSPTSSSFNPSANDANQGRDGDRDTAWRTVAETFGRNFTNVSGGAARWRSRLAGQDDRYITGSLAKQLATVDVRNVPAGDYAGIELIKDSTYDLTVEVSYRQGWSLQLSMITDGVRWQVYAVDKST